MVSPTVYKAIGMEDRVEDNQCEPLLGWVDAFRRTCSHPPDQDGEAESRESRMSKDRPKRHPKGSYGTSGGPQYG